MNDAAFQSTYQKLNPAQREAVDTLDGPVLVVAGPGTGKTQLLSMRVANILRQADVAPQNILCLTFTEDAARNMRERLSTIIGPTAYNVAINTFHGFGAGVIARYGEHFYQGVGSQPIDELAKHQIFQRLFGQLAHDNPLSVSFEDKFLFLEGAKKAIDDFRSAGLTPQAVKDIAVHNLDFVAIANPKITEIMDGFTRVDKSTPARLQKMLGAFASLERPQTPANDLPIFIKPLALVTAEALQNALLAYEDSGKTTALTEFKNNYLVRNATGNWQLKDSESCKKILALADIYQKYITELRQADLIDFSDMITSVLHALETSPELRFDLQEQYQYILVDEFQDTSLAQLQILHYLTDSPVFDGRPNILAVGDDDQAIYSFQGAELSNILHYHKMYRDVRVITLTENYRSRQDILDAAEFVISQSEERLVDQLDGVSKHITAKNESLPQSFLAHHQFAGQGLQYQWVTSQIKQLIDGGIAPSDIAIIAAKHSALKGIAPYLQAQNIPVNYSKRENILDVPAISELIVMAKLVHALGKNDQATANALFPQVLSFGFWGLSTKQIWHLYLENYRKRSPWLQTALESKEPKIVPIAEFLIDLGLQAASTPLETMLDWLTGTEPMPTKPAAGEQLSLVAPTFTSPFKQAYFAENSQQDNAASYLELLSHLHFLRNRLREYRAGEQLFIGDFVEYLELVKSAGIQLVDTTPHRQQHDAVSLHTAHSSKGLEFGSVFIIDANHEIWNSSGSAMGKISLPHNLPIERAAGGDDERRRLFFVAVTRAKYFLVISGFTAEKRGSAPLKYLAGQDVPEPLQLTAHAASDDAPTEILNQLNTSWQDRHFAGAVHAELRDLLLPTLEKYRLSFTHLQRFLNIVDGGPNQWLLQCLLHFPQAPAANMVFGNAVHATLESAQKSFQRTGQRASIESLLEDFDQVLHKSRLPQDTEARLHDLGHKTLIKYFAERYDGFDRNEHFEFDLSARNLVIDGVHVTGKLDRVTPLGDDNYRVSDFKTGRPLHSWTISDPSKRIRLHQYRQQLAFYRLLLEESRAFGPKTKVVEAAIEFVQSDSDGNLVPPLAFAPSDDDVARLRAIIKGAWQAMRTLELPDVSAYPKTLAGIVAFEDALVEQASGTK